MKNSFWHVSFFDMSHKFIGILSKIETNPVRSDSAFNTFAQCFNVLPALLSHLVKHLVQASLDILHNLSRHWSEIWKKSETGCHVFQTSHLKVWKTQHLWNETTHILQEKPSINQNTTATLQNKKRRGLRDNKISAKIWLFALHLGATTFLRINTAQSFYVFIQSSQIFSNVSFSLIFYRYFLTRFFLIRSWFCNVYFKAVSRRHEQQCVFRLFSPDFWASFSIFCFCWVRSRQTIYHNVSSDNNARRIQCVSCDENWTARKKLVGIVLEQVFKPVLTFYHHLVFLVWINCENSKY